MEKDFTIIIPVYNEEKRIVKTLHSLLKFLKHHNLKLEIIVVDDGSTDHTLFILKQFIGLIKIVPIAPNRGKGFAIRAGMIAASRETILFMDADLATPLTEISKILRVIINNDADLVIGSRNLEPHLVRRTPFRLLASSIFNFISHLLIPIRYKDTQCGFKVFKEKAAKEIFSRTQIDRWAFDLEVLYLADKLDLKVVECPVEWTDMAGSKVKLFKDAFLMIKDLFRIRFLDLTNSYNLESSSLEERSFDVLRESGSEAKEL